MFDDERQKFPPWQRFAMGSLLIFLTTAILAGLWAFDQRETIAGEIKKIPGLSAVVDVAPGGPQTILLLGSDHRSSDVKGAKPRSDTMMLVHLDADAKATTVLSLPRDLKLDIPGYRNNAKLNEAYAVGGPKLTVKTIKALTGLKINHVINVDFKGFIDAVTKIGCVYVDVDRRYFNNNAGQVIGNQYATINLYAGYQRLCGTNALDYVRYRHTDSDIVREARQQAFLRQAKQGMSTSKLINNATGLAKIVAKNTSTDASLTRGKNLQKLLALAVASAGKPVAQIDIKNLSYPTIGGASYVVASQAAIHAAAERFLGEAAPATAQLKREPGAPSAEPRPRVKHQKKSSVASAPGLMKDSLAGKTQAFSIRARTRMPVYYPTKRLSNSAYGVSSAGTNMSRAYRIVLPDQHRKSSYRIVVRVTNENGAYYGIQGTMWSNPPILNGPYETRKIGRRTFHLYWFGRSLGLVEWQLGPARYWISNTLSSTLSAKQMLGIASSTKLLK